MESNNPTIADSIIHAKFAYGSMYYLQDEALR